MAIAAGNVELAKYKEVLNRVRAERDTWEKAASRIKTGGDSGDTSIDRDSSIPRPTTFTGNEKDIAKRTSQFRTWQTRVIGR